MAINPEEQRALTADVIEMLLERAGNLNDIIRVPDDTIAVPPFPFTTGCVLVSEEGGRYALIIEPLETSRLVLPNPITIEEQTVLMEAAEQLGDAASGDLLPEHLITWDVWDGNRSSVGQEYLLAPDRAGWHTLLKNGRVVEVSVRYADPDTAHQVRMEMDEGYALAHADEELFEEITPDNAYSGEHFETDSGTPPEGDPEIAAERALAPNRRIGWSPLARRRAADLDDEMPGACDITGE